MSHNSDDDAGEEKKERFEDRIKALLRTEPFQPFVIVLTSGDRYEVTNEWALAIGGGAVSTVFPPKQSRFYFRTSQIVAIEVHEPAT